MDHQKDNRFRHPGDGVNSQGQNRNIYKGHTQTEPNKTISTPPAMQKKTQQTEGPSFILRKIEKLTTALYMVTDIMSDKEPLKWKARETGVELLSDTTISLSSSASERMSALRQVMKQIERVVSFLDIAQSTRMLSEMNASVLKREYLALKDIIEAEWRRVYDESKSIFNESFFEVEQLPERTLESGRTTTVDTPAMTSENKGQNTIPPSVTHSSIQGHNHVPEVPAETPKPVTQNTPAPRMSFTSNRSGNSDLRSALQALAPERENFKGDSLALKGVSLETFTPEESTPRVTPLPPITPRVGGTALTPVVRATISESGVIERTRPDVGRDDRRKIILALIKQKPSLTVKDIAKSIPGVSEKTIQRELLAMVAEAILVKRGERRWSTYSLRT